MGGNLGVAVVHRPGLVTGRHACVRVPKTSGGDRDAVRVGHPARVRSPQVVRCDIGKPGGLQRLHEAATEPVIALLASSGVALAAWEHEHVRAVRQSGQVLGEQPSDEGGHNQLPPLVILRCGDHRAAKQLGHRLADHHARVCDVQVSPSQRCASPIRRPPYASSSTRTHGQDARVGLGQARQPYPPHGVTGIISLSTAEAINLAPQCGSSLRGEPR
jgi:hypothetical protein